MTISTLDRPRTGSDYAELSRRISAAGLLRRRPGYYAFRFAAVGVGLLATWLTFLTLGDSPWQLLVAVAAAAGSGQVALLAHDVAHRQVFRGRRASAVVGRTMGNLGIGMSYGAWQDKHTRHHANPNHDGLDPDVAPGALAFSSEQARASRGPFRFVQRHQRALFFPLLTLAGVDLRVTSVKGLLNNPRIPARRLEAVLLAVHVVGYLALLFTLLPPLLAVGFLVVHQALFGVYLGSIFAPNHKGMEMPERRLDFLRKQVLTSRNVRGSALTDRPLHVLMGGLNHQIEHHLFPSMPTANLRAARPIVRGYCAELGVSYHETGLVRSWREILDHLHEVGEPLRAEL
ncbi:fatty acid desaturase family protein [Pseudonocardia sp. CA-107938]|uniref:fatty acid desaturase family protein n=1 Tax=Pseudonocardia sp. CA-107938 TaxID=3240021 RepID=UPI003D89BBC1